MKGSLLNCLAVVLFYDKFKLVTLKFVSICHFKQYKIKLFSLINILSVAPNPYSDDDHPDGKQN